MCLSVHVHVCVSCGGMRGEREKREGGMVSERVERGRGGDRWEFWGG